VIINEGRLEVRWYRPSDMVQLVGLHQCCLPKEGWTSKDFWKFVHKAGTTNILKVLSDDQGKIVYGTLLYTLGPGECRLRRVCVWPDYRRRGLGTFMVHTTMTSPRSSLKNRNFVAKVKEADVTAQLFLRKLDFTFNAKEARAQDDEGKDYYVFRFKKPEFAALATG